MATMDNGSAADLMMLSEREDRIVHAEWTVGREADLLADSADTAEHAAQDGVAVTEYWSADTDCDGEPVALWRVHLHRSV